jgi:hypothetical protein
MTSTTTPPASTSTSTNRNELSKRVTYTAINSRRQEPLPRGPKGALQMERGGSDTRFSTHNTHIHIYIYTHIHIYSSQLATAELRRSLVDL